MLGPRGILDFLKQVWTEFSNDDCFRLAAALSYYTLFSLAPFLVVVMAIAGLIVGQEAAQGQIFDELSGMLGKDSAQAIQTMADQAYQPGKNFWAIIIGAAVLLFSSTTVFFQIQKSLNIVWGVKGKVSSSFKHTLKVRGMSFLLILGTGFLLLVSLMLEAGTAAFFEIIRNYVPEQVMVMTVVVQQVLTLTVVTVLFAMIYRVLPDVEIAWSDVAVGSFVTALLFTLGRWAIGLYLGNSHVGQAYGAAASVVVLLVWINYSSLILFLGAEFTQVYANRFGSHIRAAVRHRHEAQPDQSA